MLVLVRLGSVADPGAGLALVKTGVPSLANVCLDRLACPDAVRSFSFGFTGVRGLQRGGAAGLPLPRQADAEIPKAWASVVARLRLRWRRRGLQQTGQPADGP